MAGFKSKVEQLASCVLRKAGVPEQQIPARMKSLGSAMILVSIAAVLPLLFFDNVPVKLKFILQLLWALLLCTGMVLAIKPKN